MTRNTQGNDVQIDATVVSAQDIPEGSLLWLGSLTDISGTGTGTDTTPDNNIMEVVSFDVTKDLKNRHTRREAMLARYKANSIVTG